MEWVSFCGSILGGLIGGIFISMLVGVPDKNNKIDRINGVILSIIYLGFLIYLANENVFKNKKAEKDRIAEAVAYKKEAGIA